MMTPEELKEYVDSAFKLRDHFSLLFYILVPIISIGASLLISYIREKGKNIATQEDIGKITGEIESVKTGYTAKIEKLRADLSVKGHFSQIRYERELKIYEEIWPPLYSLQQAALSLRPVIDAPVLPGETEESRKQARAANFMEASKNFIISVEHNRPFYPDSVWREIKALLDHCWQEAIDYRYSNQVTDWQKYWKTAEVNSKAINEQVEKICESIRKRLSEFD